MTNIVLSSRTHGGFEESYNYVDAIHERAQENYEKSQKKVNTYHNHVEVPMYRGFEAG